jgi:hypothetical protein
VGMSLDLPYGWAGSLMINASSYIVDQWAIDNLPKPQGNFIVKNYGPDLCEVNVRKPQDLTLFILRWK